MPEEEKRTTSVTIPVEPSLKERLERAADRQRRPLTNWCYFHIVEALEAEERDAEGGEG